MLKWTDQTFAHNPKPVVDKETLKNHSTPFSSTRMAALSKLVKDLTTKYQTQ
jgi:hypothetical protein